MIIIGADYHPGFQQIAFVDKHRQVEILTAPFRVAAHRDLRRFHQ